MSNVSSSIYDLATYAVLSTVILEQSLLLVGSGEGARVGEQGVKTGNLTSSDSYAVKTSYLNAGKQKKKVSLQKIKSAYSSVHESPVTTLIWSVHFYTWYILAS